MNAARSKGAVGRLDALAPADHVGWSVDGNTEFELLATSYFVDGDGPAPAVELVR